MKTLAPILATDLDGTLIPSEPLNAEREDTMALKQLSQRVEQGELEIVFVTGRHFQSVMSAIQSFDLPRPNWIVCDVGSSLYQRSGSHYCLIDEYHRHLQEITSNRPPSVMSQPLKNLAGLRLQEAEKQSANKLSFYCDAKDIDHCVQSIHAILQRQQLPHSIIHSIDPFEGMGLIDILPRGVNKAYALQWWCHWKEIDHEQVTFAGDSGNDFDALTSNFRGIVVANADRTLADRITQHHHVHGSLERIYLALTPYTAGVLEGCHHYGLLKNALR